MVKILRVKIVARTYATATAETPIHTDSHHIVVEDGSNLVEACYTHLKSLPEFAGAQDA